MDAGGAEHLHGEEAEDVFVDESEIAGVVADDDDENNDDNRGDEANSDGENNNNNNNNKEDEIVLEDDSVQGFFAHKESVYSVALHPRDPTLVVSGGGDDRAYVWRADTGEQVAELDKHADTVGSVRFSADGAFVAAGGMDGRVNVYNVQDRTRCAALEGPDEIQWLDWHPKGPVLLAGAGDASLWMWELPSGRFMNVFSGHGAAVSCGRFTHAGRNIVSGSENGSLIVWDPKTASVVRRFSPDDERFHSEGITCLDIARDDQVVLTGSMDATAKLVHVNGTILGSLENATESVEAVGLCAALPLAATGSVDGSLSIWDLNTMRLRATLRHDDSVTRLLWHADSPLLTSASTDCTVRTWDARTGDCVRTWKGHQEGIMDFAIAPGASHIVTASDDGCCLVFAP